jgi:hypothetical protein
MDITSEPCPLIRSTEYKQTRFYID